MRAHRVARLVMVSCLMLLPAAVRAQTVVSGAIAGVVRDTTGGVLPGVTVEAASPALIEKVRTVVTDDQGLYRIVDLRPGLYTVTFSLAGFGTVRREGIELTTAFTATVNAELKVGALEETVTVSGETPVVDIQNVMQQKVFSRDVLDSLPTGKNVQLYATLIPGAVIPATSQDVGGTQTEHGGGTFGIHGLRSSDMNVHLDGMQFNHKLGAGGSPAFSVNRASAQEVVLETSGIAAESETGGIQFNVVPKEGGNTFAGYFVTSFSNEDLQNSNNLTDKLRARGLTASSPVKKVYDLGVGLGGPIKKDKLWFYTAHRWWGSQQWVPGSYWNKTQDSWFYTPDLSRPAHSNDYYQNSDIRLTWQASQKNKVNFTYAKQDNCNCMVRLLFGNQAPEASGNHIYSPNYLTQVSWSYPATNRLLFEAGATTFILGITKTRVPPVGLDTIAVLELSTGFKYRARAEGLGATDTYGLDIQRQHNQRFAVSYITGSHAFKTGLFLQEVWHSHNNEINGDVLYIFRNGVPQSVQFFVMPHIEENRLIPNVGIYGQDQWTIRKLTLNLGVRFDYLNGYIPEQHLPGGQFVPARTYPRVSNVPNWKDLSPRLGAAYDLFGTAKTALKVSLGRYVAGEGTSGLVNRNNPINTEVGSATRTWTDANGDFSPQPSELGPLSDASFGQVKIVTRYAENVPTGWGNRGHNWQGSASIQHELRPGLALNVGYFRTWYGNFTVTDNLAVTPADYDPYCITPPVDARLPGGGGNQVCGLYDVRPGKFGQVDNLVTFAKNYGKQTEVFNGVDATMTARFGNGGLLSGGLSIGRTVTDNCFALDSPQVLRDGFCHISPPWSAGTQVKFFGAYPLPWDLQASANFQNIPGIPVAASYVATSAEIAPSLGRNLAQGARGTATIDLIPPRRLFEDRIMQVDVRLTKIFRMGRARVQGMFDAYNVFNASPILNMVTRYGPRWLEPTQILAARLFKVGVQLDF